MFAHTLIILSDFALILLGLVLGRAWPQAYSKPFWVGAEKLVYYVLFPALLFGAINGAAFDLRSDALMLSVAVAVLLGAAAAGFGGRWLFRPADDVFAASVRRPSATTPTSGWPWRSRCSARAGSPCWR